MASPYRNVSRSSYAHWERGCRGCRGGRSPGKFVPLPCPAPKPWRGWRRQPQAAGCSQGCILALLGTNPVGINQNQDIAFKDLSFGSSEINQNGFTWPRLLQAYICLKHLFFKSKELCLLLFLFLLPCSPRLFSFSFLLHILFFLSSSPWLPSKCKKSRGRQHQAPVWLSVRRLPFIVTHFVVTSQ